MDGYREEQWLGRMEFWIVLILVTCHGLELSKSTCQGHLVDGSQDLLVVPCSPFTQLLAGVKIDCPQQTEEPDWHLNGKWQRACS